MDRRSFLASVSATAAGTCTFGFPASAIAVKDSALSSWDAQPPMVSAEDFVAWGVRVRGEQPAYLKARFERFRRLERSGDLASHATKRAFLLTPREAFLNGATPERAYQHAFLDIGSGVSIPGPHVVSRMVQALDISRGQKVLEVGTGSGYVAAFLANLTEEVWTIEISAPLAERAKAASRALLEKGRSEYAGIRQRAADGYEGWADAAPFDRIIVGCGIDHVPPALLRQLAPDGVMIIPLGPLGVQHLYRVTGTSGRTDIYDARIFPIAAFLKRGENGKLDGTHDM